MPFGQPDTFEVNPAIWGTPASGKPSFADNEELKKQFGIELAKDHRTTFEAACVVFGEDTNGALWVSVNWLNDPVVTASRDLYRKTCALNTKLLDKEQFLAKLLDFADAKHPQHPQIPLHESKDVLKALELYAKASGFIDKDNGISSNVNSINNLTIKFVDPDVKETPQLIENEPENIIQDDDTEIKIRLVG